MNAYPKTPLSVPYAVVVAALVSALSSFAQKHYPGDSREAVVLDLVSAASADEWGASSVFWFPDASAFRAGMNFKEDSHAEADGASAIRFGEEKADPIGEFSFAAGFNNVASGKASLAIGEFNRVLFADHGVAIGLDNEVDGLAGIAIGYANTVFASHGVALGFANTVVGSSAVAFGYTNEAFGPRAIAFGEGNRALSTASIAGGFQSEAKEGKAAVALGYHARARGHRSAAFNSYTLASGRNSAAFGESTRTDHDDSFVVGRFNDPLSGESSANRPLFMVGFGEGDHDTRNAIEVRANGDVIIKRIPPRGGISMGNFGKTD